MLCGHAVHNLPGSAGNYLLYLYASHHVAAQFYRKWVVPMIRKSFAEQVRWCALWSCRAPTTVFTQARAALLDREKAGEEAKARAAEEEAAAAMADETEKTTAAAAAAPSPSRRA